MSVTTPRRRRRRSASRRLGTAAPALFLAACLAATPAARGDGGAAGKNGNGDTPPAGGPVRTDAVEEVHVQAGLPDDAAAFVTVLQGEDLHRRGGSVADLLRRVPGARIRDYGGPGRFATLGLRGSSADQVQVFLDGVPLNRALGGPVDLSFLPAEAIAEIRVYRGFGPASLGLGGMGGLVDIRTRRPEAAGGTRVRAQAGSFGTTRLGAGAAFHGAGLVWSASVERFATEGDFEFLDTRQTPFNPDDDRITRRSNNDTRARSLWVQGVRHNPRGFETRVRLEHRRRRQGVPGVESFTALHARAAQARTSLLGTWVRPRRHGPLRRVEWQADLFTDRLDSRDPLAELGVRKDRSTKIAGGGVASILRGRAGGHRWLVRADARREDASVRDRALERSDLGGGTRDLLALTLEDGFSAGSWHVAPAARVEHRRDRFRSGSPGLLPPPAPDVAEVSWSGKVGVSRPVGSRGRFRASAGRFFRSPSLLELFGDRGSVLGNPALRPEHGFSWEAGWEARPWKGFSWDVALFGRDAGDLIVFVLNAQGKAVAQNLRSAEVFGVEGSGSWEGPGNLWLEATGTWKRARDRTPGPTFGKPVVGEPAWTAFAAARWRPGRWSASWEFTYVGANPSDTLDTPERRLPARFLHDVTLARAFPSKGVEVSLDVRNVFDRRTLDVLRFPLPGRAVFLHVGWQGTKRKGGAP